MQRCPKCGKEVCICGKKSEQKCSKCGKPGCLCGMKKDDKGKK